VPVPPAHRPFGSTNCHWPNTANLPQDDLNIEQAAKRGPLTGITVQVDTSLQLDKRTDEPGIGVIIEKDVSHGCAPWDDPLSHLCAADSQQILYLFSMS
jgi:hypothetical protein